jgi:AcrR family transcriptional regulator
LETILDYLVSFLYFGNHKNQNGFLMINVLFNINPQNADERTKILIHSQSRYLREGFYRIPMDELAVDLRMSKKTIYKHFPTKEKLVEEVAQFTMNMISEKIDGIIASETDTIIKITKLTEVFGFFVSYVGEKWLMDIKVHMPVVWENIDAFRTKKIYAVFSKIFDQGKAEKIFLDLPNEVVITIFVAAIRAIVNPEFIYNNKFSHKEGMKLTLEILFNGILTDKGKKLFKKSMSKEK